MTLRSMPSVEPAAVTRRRVAQVATALLLVLAACGPDPGPSPIFTASATATGQPTPGPGVAGASVIPFVGNASCPTDGAQPYSPSPPYANASPAIGQVIPEMPHFHVSAGTHVDYEHNPPTSGCHWSSDGAPASPGVYDQPVPPEAWVHNLEHGYIVVLYDCPSGCPAVVTALEMWLTTLPPDPAGQGLIPYAKVLVTPYHGMPTPFAVLSWDYYLPLAAFDIAQVEAFYANHVGRSPEGPLSA